MKFEVATQLSPEEVIQRAEEYYGEHTGLELQGRGDNRVE